MNEDVIADFKQFIAATIRQAFARAFNRDELDDRIDSLCNDTNTSSQK